MHRPIAGPFLGSVPIEHAAGARLARQIDMSAGSLAILVSASVGAEAYALSEAPNLLITVRLGFLSLLLLSLAGLWMMHLAADAPRLAAIQVYQAVFRRLAQQGPQAATALPAEDAHAGVAGLIGDLALLTRKLCAGRARAARRAQRSNQALREGREQAQLLAGLVSQDAETLAATAGEMDLAGARLAQATASTHQSFELADTAVSRATGNIATLAGSVRATTERAEQMTILAVQLSQMAHNTHRLLADLDDKSCAIAVALHQLEQSMQLAGTLGREAGEEAGRLGIIGDPLAGIAAQWRRAVADCHPSLEQALASARELGAEAKAAICEIAEISALVRASHEAGHGIGHAVAQQGEEIARALQDIYEARSGYAILRAGVEAVTRAQALPADLAESLRRTARQLPSHAENVASILRDIPDFLPPKD